MVLSTLIFLGTKFCRMAQNFIVETATGKEIPKPIIYLFLLSLLKGWGKTFFK